MTDTSKESMAQRALAVMNSEEVQRAIKAFLRIVSQLELEGRLSVIEKEALLTAYNESLTACAGETLAQELGIK